MPTPHSITPSIGYVVNPNAVTFDGELLTDANIVTQFARHESSPERTINTLPIARRDGSVFVMSRFGEKIVRLQGVIVGSSAADLESRLDAFKELVSREQKELAIFSAGVKRVYVATAKEPTFERDHFHITFIPYTIEFVVASGEGLDAATTSALASQSLSTTSPATTSFEMLGTKAARPVITIEGGNWPTDVRGLSLEDTDTGEKIIVNNNVAWGTNSIIEIDCDTKQVTQTISGIESTLDFLGTIPGFRVGTNNLKLTVGKLLSKGTTEPSISDVSAQSAMGSATYYSQSFLNPYTDATFQKIRLPFKKFGSPTGNIVVEIRADDGTGKPSGSYVVQMTMAISGITTSMAYYELTAASPFTLNGNTTYWVVAYGSAVDNSNGFYWGSVAASYGISGGAVRVSIDSGGTWQSPISRYQAFALYNGGKDGSSTALLSVAYRKTYL